MIVERHSRIEIYDFPTKSDQPIELIFGRNLSLIIIHLAEFQEFLEIIDINTDRHTQTHRHINADRDT